MSLLIKWILAHLIGDFLLQSKSWIEKKEQHRWRSGVLYLHAAIHFFLVLLFTWDISIWYAAAIIGLSHLMIDATKLQFQTPETKPAWFFTDQLLHLAVIFFLWIGIYQPDITGLIAWDLHIWAIITAIAFLTVPASSIIDHTMSRWSDSIEEEGSGSLQNAGKYIGILERLFIFISILAGYWQTVGFLLAAKSIFRFGDLTNARDRILTEYILIGTLISFAIAMGTALLVGML